MYLLVTILYLIKLFENKWEGVGFFNDMSGRNVHCMFEMNFH